MRIGLTAAGTAMAVACFLSAAHADEANLTAASIQHLFPGYYKAEVKGGYIVLIFASSDGGLDGKAFGREEKGKWSVVGDQLCVSWKTWMKGKTKCAEIVRAGGWYIARNHKKRRLLRFTAIGADKFLEQVANASDVDRN